MANTKKNIQQKDIWIGKTLIHESIPLTGAIASGTYGEPTAILTSNVKEYSHGLLQSLYDYPYPSASANHIYDITVGLAPSGIYGGTFAKSGSSASTASWATKAKLNIYKQMAAQLCGVDATGTIRDFDRSGDFGSKNPDTKMASAIFINLSRLIVKDGIEDGSFELTFGTGNLFTEPFHYPAGFGQSPYYGSIRVTDSGSTTYNGVAGEYRLLYSAANGEIVAGDTTKSVGLLFKQYGIAVLELSSSAVSGVLWDNDVADPIWQNRSQFTTSSVLEGTLLSFTGALASGTINEVATGVRNRIKNITFNNNVELNSVKYMCRAEPHEFNYSSNPTYLDQSGSIRMRQNKIDVGDFKIEVTSFISSVGLYSPDNQLLAVGKLSNAIEKRPGGAPVDVTLRLDY